jgi:FtsZ-interacting cell division protein ZipA
LPVKPAAVLATMLNCNNADKDLLRIVIIAVGAVVILAMVLWAMFSEGSKRKKINFYDDHDPLENIDPSLVVSTQDDDFDIVSISTRKDTRICHTGDSIINLI